MALPSPTIVFRSHLISEANAMVAHLRDCGLHAALAPDNIAGPLGASPIAGPIHQVMASDCDADAVLAAIDSFAGNGSVSKSGGFCYECGLAFAEPVTVCPSCGGSIEEPEESPDR
ncbi:MAG: hypothetical protein WBD31_20540 [Rubripirellula sp.]